MEFDELVNSLRLMARLVRDYDYKEISRILREAADTIESLQAKTERTCKPVEYKVGNNGFALKPGVYDEYYGPFCVCSECSSFVPWGSYCMDCGAKFEVVLDSSIGMQ